MANQPESASYDAGVYQLATTDPVQGGPGGIANSPLLNLANRTAYLKQHLDNIENGTTVPTGLAVKNSPVFTGDPQAPTPPLGDNDNSIATSQFVQGTINGVLTKSVAGGVNVTLTAVEAGNGILIFTGTLTANVAVIVPTSGKQMLVVNRTSGGYSLTVKTAAGTGIAVAQGKQQELACDGVNVILASSDFTGIAIDASSTVPTAAVDTNSAQIASTSFVLGQAAAASPLMNGAAAAGSTTRFARADHVHPIDTSRAPLASPSFTGAPQAPLAAQFDNSSAIVTSAFVQRALGNLQGATQLGVGATTNLTASGLGKYHQAQGGIINLPPSAAIPLGSTYLLSCSGATTLVAPGSEKIFTGSIGVTSLSLNEGDCLQLTLLVAGASGVWEVTAGVTSGTAAQFDNSTRIATTAFVRNAGLQGGGVLSYTASVAMPVSAIGKHILFGMASGGQVVTLPDLTTTSGGAMVTIFNYGQAMTLVASGSQTINNFGSIGNIVVPGNTTLILSSESGGGVGRWDVLAGTGLFPSNPMFAASGQGNGWQKHPSGIIVQWGNGSNGAGDIVTNLPIAFPNNVFAVVAASGYTAGSTSIGYVAASATSLSQITARLSNTGLGWGFVAYGN